MQILIAEDEVRLAAFLEKGLRKSGFNTSVAIDGNQALLMAQTEAVDLILLDLGLPEQDGMEVLEKLRSQGKQYPIIVVTARCDDRDKAKALQAGANDYITKPFSFKDLLARVNLHLEQTA